MAVGSEIFQGEVSKAVPDQSAGLSIRAMEESDLEEVVAIEKRLFRDPWTREHFRSELYDSPHSCAYVALWQGKRVGYIIVWCIADELHIANLAVDVPYRQRGIGQELLQWALDLGRRKGAKRALLEVRRSNAVAIALYRKFGFQQVGIRRRYYRPEGEDAILMEKTL